MEELKKALLTEGKYHPSEALVERLLGQMEEIVIPAKKALIAPNAVDPSLYIVKSGITRVAYFDGQKEVTFGFSSVGTVFISPGSYYMRTPASFYVYACNQCHVMRLGKEEFDALLDACPEFCRWMFDQAMYQFYGLEIKLNNVTCCGQTAERYKAIAKHRPDIISAVPMKVLASYLGVTNTYLCNIRKQLLTDERKKNINKMGGAKKTLQPQENERNNP